MNTMRWNTMDHVVVNVQSKEPDEDQRSLRGRVGARKNQVLRDTYYLISGDNSPSKRLTMGYTTVYPTGTTTGHTHEDREEVYFVVSGEGVMVIGEDKFPVKAGDGLYVPPGLFHTTIQTGNLPLTVIWVTGRVDAEDKK
jgi:mannose-6-phosphate isomerase-like protein (cupin superfamily)